MGDTETNERAMRLTAALVDEVVKDCLYLVVTSRKPEGAIEVRGVQAHFGFNPASIEARRADIQAMLDDLPLKFREGASFLEACCDRTGNQWTGDHRAMDRLFCLGMAIGQVRECAPREFWPALPGGVPYYFVAQTGGPVPWLQRLN